MTGRQKAYLLKLLHITPAIERKETLYSELKNMGISENDIPNVVLEVENAFDNGIRNLNKNQLDIILKTAAEKLNINDIKRRLTFFEINEDHHANIIQFFQDYILGGIEIDVEDLDKEFKGVQVASRDDFNDIINKGWTGDWTLEPQNIPTQRIQVASMNDNGPFPRGYYLNADIVKIQAIDYNGSPKYRIYIANPVIINTGNRNVRFIAQPVRYMR